MEGMNEGEGIKEEEMGDDEKDSDKRKGCRVIEGS
jgi:hypothetical protein